jgi:hypothetical protein
MQWVFINAWGRILQLKGAESAFVLLLFFQITHASCLPRIVEKLLRIILGTREAFLYSSDQIRVKAL